MYGIVAVVTVEELGFYLNNVSKKNYTTDFVQRTKYTEQNDNNPSSSTVTGNQ